MSVITTNNSLSQDYSHLDDQTSWSLGIIRSYNYHSAGTVPVFCRFRCTTHGSPFKGAAPKFKSIIARVLTGTLRLVLCKFGSLYFNIHQHDL